MNRREFLSALIGELRSVEPSELQNILQYYNEYFDDAGEENESAVIAELGDVKKLGAKLRATSAVRFLEEKPVKSGKGMKAVWIAIISIFAAPIALPIAIALFAVALSLVMVVIVIFISFFVVGVSFGAAAIVFFLAGIIATVEFPPAAITFFGLSVLMVGLCIVTVIPTAKVTALFFKWLALMINKGLVKKHNSNQKNDPQSSYDSYTQYGAQRPREQVQQAAQIEQTKQVPQDEIKG